MTQSIGSFNSEYAGRPAHQSQARCGACLLIQWFVIRFINQGMAPSSNFAGSLKFITQVV